MQLRRSAGRGWGRRGDHPAREVGVCNYLRAQSAGASGISRSQSITAWMARPVRNHGPDVADIFAV